MSDGVAGVSSLQTLKGNTLHVSSQNNLSIGKRVVQVSASLSHSGCVSEDGRLWMWGKQSHGRLGNGDSTDKSIGHPVSVVVTANSKHTPTATLLSPTALLSSNRRRIVKVACGGYHTIVLDGMRPSRCS